MMTFDLPHHLRARGEQQLTSAANDNSFARVLADLVGPWGRRQQDGGAPASAYPEVPYV
jgi:hypothetical protein